MTEEQIFEMMTQADKNRIMELKAIWAEAEERGDQGAMDEAHAMANAIRANYYSNNAVEEMKNEPAKEYNDEMMAQREEEIFGQMSQTDKDWINTLKGIWLDAEKRGDRETMDAAHAAAALVREKYDPDYKSYDNYDYSSINETETGENVDADETEANPSTKTKLDDEALAKKEDEIYEKMTQEDKDIIDEMKNIYAEAEEQGDHETMDAAHAVAAKTRQKYDLDYESYDNYEYEEDSNDSEYEKESNNSEIEAASLEGGMTVLRDMVEKLGGSVTTKNNLRGKLSSITVSLKGKSVTYTSKDFTINSDGRAIIHSQKILNDFFGNIGSNGSAPPTREQAMNYIVWNAWYKGVPYEIALATAARESGFEQFENGSAKRGGNDYGMMQINSWWRDHVFSSDQWYGILNNWHRNVDAGMDILANSYRKAKEAGYSIDDMDMLAKATYAHYNDGNDANAWKKAGQVQVNTNAFFDIYNNKKW